METRRLEVFVALVDAGGFKRAAASLFITQPALSQQISRLEKDIGIQLIDRSTRPITMTEAGKDFYFRSRKVLDAMQGIAELLDDSRDRSFGRVRIGIVSAMLFSFPSPAVRSFILQYPDVEVTMRNIGTSQLIEELEQGMLDVAILLTEPRVKGVSSIRLFSEDYMVCLPLTHRLADRDAVTFSDLREERILQGPRVSDPEGYDSVVAACMEVGFSPRSFSVLGSYMDHAGMVSAGMGVSLVPVSMTEHLPRGVTARRITKPTPRYAASLSWYEHRLDSIGRAFVDHFRSTFDLDYSSLH